MPTLSQIESESVFPVENFSRFFLTICSIITKKTDAIHVKNDANSMFISGKLVKNDRFSREISENSTFNTKKMKKKSGKSLILFKNCQEFVHLSFKNGQNAWKMINSFPEKKNRFSCDGMPRLNDS